MAPQDEREEEEEEEGLIGSGPLMVEQ